MTREPWFADPEMRACRRPVPAVTSGSSRQGDA